MDTNSIVRILPLVSILLAVVCVLVQALMPVSRTKGNTRLAGSILLSAGLCAESLIQMTSQHGFWPKVILLPMGGVLSWLGVRKHSRDPEGRTPPAAILCLKWSARAPSDLLRVLVFKSFGGASPRRFRPTYALANVGHPSFPLRLSFSDGKTRRDGCLSNQSRRLTKGRGTLPMDSRLLDRRRFITLGRPRCGR
jgi:hypothetical protein